MAKIGVLFPVLNNWAGVCLAVNSLRSVKHQLQVHIINNASLSLSVAESWNVGINFLMSQCDYVLVSNDDVIFSPATVDALVARMEEGGAGMVTGHNWRERMPPEQMLAYSPQPPFEEHEHPDFSCFLLNHQLWEAVGTFDQNFRPAYYEDNDYHARIVLAGGKGIQTTSAPYYHFGSVTIKGKSAQPILTTERMEHSQRYFLAKWGNQPVAEPDEMRKLYYSRPFNDLRYSVRDWPRPDDVERLVNALEPRPDE